MAVIGGEDVDTKGEQRLQGQEGQETYTHTHTHLHEVPGTHPLVSHLVLALALAVAEDGTCPPEEECACMSEECGGG